MDRKLAQVVYDRLMGYDEQSPLDFPVENLFAEGATCDALYEGIYAARLRICQRLGTEEDKDLEEILDAFLQINRLVGEKMFYYATRLAEQQ